MIKKKSSLQIYIFCSLLILILCLAFFRDWEGDEAWTYNFVQKNSFWDLLIYSKFKFANNHLFNSLYFKLLQDWGITLSVIYRIPGIAGFIVFFYASLEILKYTKTPKAFIILIIVAPYFSFFALGRGYSLALGYLAMSILYLLKFITYRKVKYQYLLVIFGILSCLSIFSFLYSFLSIIIIHIFFQRKQLLNIHTILLCFLVLAAVVYVYHCGKIVNDSDPYIIGSNSLFKNGTIGTIIGDISCFPFLNNSLLYKFFKIFIIISMASPLVYYTKNVFFKKKSVNNSAEGVNHILLILIVLNILLMILSNILFNAKYPLNRGAFFLQYLFLLFVIIQTINYSQKLLFYFPLFILSIASLITFISIYSNLAKPNIQDILLYSNKSPLYIVQGYNPNITLTNQLLHIGKDNLIQSDDLNDINTLIKDDSSATKYLLCNNNSIDSLKFKVERAFECRDNLTLYKIIH